MARKHARPDVSRRKFLAGVSGCRCGHHRRHRCTRPSPGATANKRLPSAVMPNTLQIAAETGGLREPTTQIPGRPASDYMVDVIKSLNIEYIYSNPASSFRGLHESLINYGKNKMPEFLTVTHEEASVAMCHGHFKATGKPQMALMHGTVGLQHAAMAVYNAWADRVPLFMMEATISMLPSVRRACRPCIPRRTSTRWSGTSPSGTTSRFRCSISRSRSCAPTNMR